jgi:hypothetical protein
VTGAINTSALTAKTSATAGSAGSIDIQTGSALLGDAGSDIFVGSLIATGGANNGTGAGGNGGTVTLITNPYPAGTEPLHGESFATIKVSGFINISGGNAVQSKTTSTSTSNGGSGGHLDVQAGAFAVTSSSGGISINAKPGLKGPNGNGAGTNSGTVTIQTYAVQELPSNLNLTSTTKNIAQDPGAMFSVGIAAPVNGTAGSIATDLVTNNNITNKTSFGTSGNGFAGQIVKDFPSSNGKVNIDISNPSSIVVVNAKGARNLLTPAQALAQYQTDRGQTPVVTVTSTGALASGPQSATISELDINGMTFTGFNLPSNMTLNITGARPYLNLPNNLVLNGHLMFDSGSTDFINLNGANMTNNGTIGVNGGGSDTLILGGTGGTWTNNGTINTGAGGELVIARPTTGPLTFVSNAHSSLTATEVLLSPTLDAGMNMTFRANGVATGNDVPGDANVPIEFGSFAVPTLYQASSSALGGNASTARTVSLQFAMSDVSGGTLQPLTAVVGGEFNSGFLANANSITIRGIASSVTPPGAKPQTVQTAVTVQNGANLAANGAVSISTTGGKLTIGSATVTAGTSMNLSAAGATNTLQISDNATLTAATTLTATSAGLLQIGNNDTLTSGQLGNNPPNMSVATLLVPGQIIKNGAMTLSSSGSAGVSIGNNDTLTNNGSRLQILATKGAVTTPSTPAANIAIGANNTMVDFGGNVVILAKGNVHTGTGNTFQAKGLTTVPTSGGVEIGSGTTASTINGGFNQKRGTTNPHITNGTYMFLGTNNGTVLINGNLTANGTVNLDFTVSGLTGVNTSQRGVVDFDSVGKGTVLMDGSETFQTQSIRPVATPIVAAATADMVVDSDADILESASADTEIAEATEAVSTGAAQATSHVIRFNSDGQSYVGTLSNGATISIIGKAGSAVSIENGVPTVLSGAVVIVCSQETTVQTRYGTYRVPALSRMAVDVTGSDRAHITNLDTPMAHCTPVSMR